VRLIGEMPSGTFAHMAQAIDDIRPGRQSSRQGEIPAWQGCSFLRSETFRKTDIPLSGSSNVARRIACGYESRQTRPSERTHDVWNEPVARPVAATNHMPARAVATLQRRRAGFQKRTFDKHSRQVQRMLSSCYRDRGRPRVRSRYARATHDCRSTCRS